MPDGDDRSGTRLPGGSFTLTADEQRRFAEAVGGDPDGDPAVTALLLATSGLRGLGTDLAQVFSAAGSDIVADGPMLGGCELEIRRPLMLDRAYDAAGEILGIERKTGRRTGAFDVLRIRLALSDAAGEVAVATASYILPRRTARRSATPVDSQPTIR